MYACMYVQLKIYNYKSWMKFYYIAVGITKCNSTWKTFHFSKEQSNLTVIKSCNKLIITVYCKSFKVNGF